MYRHNNKNCIKTVFHLWTKLFDKICQCSDFKKMNSRNFKTKNYTRLNLKIFIKIHLPAVLWNLTSTLCLSQTIFSPPKLCLPNTPPYFPIIFPITSALHPGQMEALSLHLSKARPIHELWILSSSSTSVIAHLSLPLSPLPPALPPCWFFPGALKPILLRHAPLEPLHYFTLLSAIVLQLLFNDQLMGSETS